MDLGVNIDHIATIRQARGTNYPSVLDAATLAEQGALEKFRTEKSIKVIGQTLIDMGNDNFDSATTELQSKNLMRFLINYYLGDKPLNSKQLFLNI